MNSKRKQVEVTLSLPVVAPLLDVIKITADSLENHLAAPLGMHELDGEFRDAWSGELLSGQGEDMRTLLALFDNKFFASGVLRFDDENAGPILRACSAVRLQLRAGSLSGLNDEVMESGDVELVTLDEPVRKAFMCYLFLATVQEIIIQHFGALIIQS